MRIPRLKRVKVKDVRIPLAEGGTDRRCDTLTLGETRLKNAKNFHLKNGVLGMRPAIVSRPESVITQSYEAYFRHDSVRLTDVTVTLDGKVHNIGFATVTDSYTYYTLNFFAVSGSGEVKGLSSINFTRMDSSTFYVPEGVFLAVGESTVADGLYAYVNTSSFGQSDCRIYEYDFKKSEWIRLSESDYHIPVIYINGRGSEYEKALLAGSAYEEKPIRAEELNMLTPLFEAYFSSDGISCGFQLPVTGLDDAPVLCRVYHTPSSFGEWLVPAGEDSAKCQFFGAEVTMKIDRGSGYFSFHSSDGSEYPMHKMRVCDNNNIYIKASKSLPDGAARIIGSKGSLCYNSRLYLYGNPHRPEEIYSARLLTPLYFPKSSKASVGERGDAVTAMGVQNGKIIAFKRNEMYKINVNSSADHSDNRILEDDYGNPAGNDELEAVPIHTYIGCKNKNTLTLCGNRLVWLGADNAVYTLATTTYGNQNNVYKISEMMGSDIADSVDSEWDLPFAAEDDGYYMLFSGKNVFVMNHKVKGFGYSDTFSGLREDADRVSWYRWELPGALLILSALQTESGLLLLCCEKGGGLMFISTLDINGQDDILLVRENGSITEKRYAVEGLLETGALSFGTPHRKKKLISFCPVLDGLGIVEVTLKNEEGKTASSFVPMVANGLKSVRLRPGLPPSKTVSLTLKGKRLRFDSVHFSYSDTVI